MSISIKNKSELCPSLRVKRAAPKNLNSKDEIFFAHESEKTFPPAYLYELNNVNVSREGIVFRNFEVFVPSLLNLSRKKYFTWKYILANKLKRKQVTLPNNQKYILAFNEWSGGYFHWMLDVLPRLLAFRNKIGTLKDYYLLLPGNYEQQYMFDTLKIFDFKDVYKIPPDSFLFIRDLVLISLLAPTGNYNIELIHQLQNRLSGYFDFDGLSFGEKIYVSRGKAAHRFITNESNLISTIEKMGFKAVCFEDFSIREKISICKNAKYLISAHGGGLANMLFMQKGSSVLEIRQEGDRHNNAYYSLANCMDINYYYLLSDFKNSNEHPNKYDLEIDIRRFSEVVNSMISNPN